MRIVCITIFAALCLIARPDDAIAAEPQERPTLALVVSEFEYETHVTLPAFAHRYLSKDFRVLFQQPGTGGGIIEMLLEGHAGCAVPKMRSAKDAQCQRCAVPE